MSTPNEYAVTDNEGDKLIVIRSEDRVILGVEPNEDETIMMATVLLKEERMQLAEVLTGDLLASGDAGRRVEDRWGTEVEVRVDGDIVTVVLRPRNPNLTTAFAVELTTEQAGHVHEMMTR